jgi:hypothetical protein
LAICPNVANSGSQFLSVGNLRFALVPVKPDLSIEHLGPLTCYFHPTLKTPRALGCPPAKRLSDLGRVVCTFFPLCSCQRPYHAEHTSSRLITEVKQHRAELVLGWVTAWEYSVPLAFCQCNQYYLICSALLSRCLRVYIVYTLAFKF